MRRLVLFLLLACPLVVLGATDVEFLRAWEATQERRPTSIGAIGTIAPPSEPGTRLTVHGQVTDLDGKPASDAIVFAWQTDATGVYDRPGTLAHSWRLHGWARTNQQGGFTFHTIRPGTYPDRREPAHVHFSVETKGGVRYFTRDLHFAGDPLLRGDDIAEASKITIGNGREHASIILRLDPNDRF